MSTSSVAPTITSSMDEICGLFMPLETLNKSAALAEEELLSPFVKYDDGYHWPSLYSEIDELLEPNVLIYALAQLRKLARAENTALFGSSVLDLPLTHVQLMEVIEANRKLLEDIEFGKKFYQEVLRSADERNMTRHTNQKGGPVAEKDSSCKPETIVAFDDEFAEEELVYMIEVNHRRKRVTVTFCGSVTKTDWATDYEIYMKEVENPMKKHASQEEVVRVHNGFHDYLFKPNRRGVKGLNGEPLSEYKEIFQQHLIPILNKYAGYKLYVTGHSLGAAIATLFAFEAAAEPDSIVPKPVSLFSVAGPYVGDESFCQAFQLLESLGRLRHCRIANHRDLVTTVPKFSFRWRFYDKESHVGALFKHAGMGLRLYEGSTPFEILYRKKRSGWISSSVDELSRGWDQMIFSNFSWSMSAYTTWSWHSLREYNARVQANRPALETIYLNDLYARQDIVGKLVPQF